MIRNLIISLIIRTETVKESKANAANLKLINIIKTMANYKISQRDKIKIDKPVCFLLTFLYNAVTLSLK